jgi:hypothetical protein
MWSAGAGAFVAAGPTSASADRWAQTQTPAAVADLRALFLVNEFQPPARSGGQWSRKSETRISAIADFARKGKREKKALRSLRLGGLQRAVQAACGRLVPRSARP